MRKTTNIEVELRKGNDDKISFHLKQYDDVVLNIKVYDGLTPVTLEGQTVYLAINKADNTNVLQKEDIIIEGDNIKIKLSSQAVTAVGICSMELIVEDDNGLLTTATTNFIVSESLGASITEIITSSDDIHHLKLLEDFILNANLDIAEIQDSLDGIRDRISELEEEIEEIGTEVKDSIKDNETDAIENIGNCKEMALSEIIDVGSNAINNINATKEEVLTVTNEAIEKAKEVSRDVSTAKGEVVELMATIEAAKDEVDEIAEVQVQNILGTGRSTLLEINKAKESALNEVSDKGNELLTEVSTELNKVKDEALEEINTTKDETIREINTTKDNAIGDVAGVVSSLETVKSEIVSEIGTVRDEAVSIVEGTRESAVNEINTAKNEAVGVINGTKESAVGEVYATRDIVVGEVYAKRDEVINEVSGAIDSIKDTAINIVTATKNDAVKVITDTKTEAKTEIETAKDDAINEVLGSLETIEDIKTEAIEEIGTTKDSAINEMTAKKEALAEELAQIEGTTVEGVEEAVKLAQKRLQEETIKATWEVQEFTENQKAEVEALVRQEKAGITEKAREQIERVNQAGSNMVELVEGLEADINEGLANIDKAVREGKKDVKDTSSAELEKIRTEGANIIKAVEDLEINTTNNVERINQAGRTAVNSIESKSLVEQEAIETAGAAKLEEINNILEVSKGEVEDLLTTTRNEINTHRVDFANSVLTAKNEIGNLKNSSLLEMTSKKEELVEGMLGAELELKEDLKTLKEGYVTEIDEKGTARVDALQKMIDTVDALQEAINKKIETVDTKTEILNQAIENVDNKVNEIRPALDTLDEMRNICISLQSENVKADENIAELEFLHTEADTRIVELRRLIEEAKQYEDVVQKYIDSKNGNHEEIEARLNALEEAMETIITAEGVKEIVDVSIEESLEPIRAELEELKGNVGTVGFIGKFGNGLYMEKENENFLTAPNPDFKPVHTIKYQCSTGSSTLSYVIYFKKPLTDIEGGKYVYMDNNSITGNITFDKLVRNEDYIAYRYQNGSNASWAESTTVQNISPATKSTRIFTHDFPIYTADGSSIIFENPNETGINDFNKATANGDYSINLTADEFNNLYNGVKVAGDNQVVGVLNVKTLGANKIQILDLTSHGLIYMRVIGDEWRNVADGAIAKDPLNKIKVSEEGLPEFLKDLPPLPLYGQEVKGTLIARINETTYNVYYLLDGYTGRAYYGGGTSFGLNIPQAKVYKMSYNSNTGVWNTRDTSSVTTAVGNVSVNKTYFKIYKNTIPVYTNSNTSNMNLYQDVTIPADGELTITDFNNAIETGIYIVDIKEVDENILNVPISGEVVDGMLQVIKLGSDIYQELTTNDNMRAWKRTRVNNEWTAWRTMVTEAMFYNLLK